LRWRADERCSKASKRSSRKEHVMMFAFVLALVGVVVLASFEHLGARS
jgi:uncharacterized membrane protein